jgi:hypothetical protein
MPIPDDWDFNYGAKILSHIDGVLSYDTGGGRQAAVGEYVRGSTSGAIGKILAVTGNTASGTLTLTNVEGLFEDGELIEAMSFVNFDGLIDKVQLSCGRLSITKTAQAVVRYLAIRLQHSPMIRSLTSLAVKQTLALLMVQAQTTMQR